MIYELGKLNSRIATQEQTLELLGNDEIIFKEGEWDMKVIDNLTGRRNKEDNAYLNEINYLITDFLLERKAEIQKYLESEDTASLKKEIENWLLSELHEEEEATILKVKPEHCPHCGSDVLDDTQKFSEKEFYCMDCGREFKIISTE